MITPSEICDRIEALLPSGESLASLARRANVDESVVRKSRSQNSYITTPKLISIASALNTSVAYLIGEADDPSAIPHLQTLRSGVPMIAQAVNAGASTTDPEHLAVAISIETAELEELGFLLSEDSAVVLQHRLHDAIQTVVEVRRKRDSTVVA